MHTHIKDYLLCQYKINKTKNKNQQTMNNFITYYNSSLLFDRFSSIRFCVATTSIFSCV